MNSLNFGPIVQPNQISRNSMMRQRRFASGGWLGTRGSFSGKNSPRFELAGFAEGGRPDMASIVTQNALHGIPGRQDIPDYLMELQRARGGYVGGLERAQFDDGGQVDTPFMRGVKSLPGRAWDTISDPETYKGIGAGAMHWPRDVYDFGKSMLYDLPAAATSAIGGGEFMMPDEFETIKKQNAFDARNRYREQVGLHPLHDQEVGPYSANNDLGREIASFSNPLMLGSPVAGTRKARALFRGLR